MNSVFQSMATAAIVLCAMPANAAIIEYNYTAPDMMVDYYYLNYTDNPYTDDLVDVTNDPSKWIRGHENGVGVGFAFTIDTDLLESRYISFDYSWEMPVGYNDNYGSIINVTRILLDEDYNVSWFNVDIDYGFFDGYSVSDGYASEYADACDYACYSFSSDEVGTWTRIIDGVPETGPVDVPAPVPLPAAGFLLMGALSGLSLIKRRNKAAE